MDDTKDPRYEVPHSHLADDGKGDHPSRKFITEEMMASRWVRLFGFVVDQVVVAITFYVLSIPATVVWSAAVEEVVEFPSAGWVFEVLLASTIVAYYVTLEHVFGATLGKVIGGTRVVDEYGNGLTLGRSVTRTLWRLFPLGPVFLLFSSSALHDSFSGTYVVPARVLALKRDRS